MTQDIKRIVLKEIKELGAKLRRQRRIQEMSQDKVAFELNVSLPTIGRMEKGVPGVALVHYCNYCKLLGSDYLSMRNEK